jgi:hypothetical protein
MATIGRMRIDAKLHARRRPGESLSDAALRVYAYRLPTKEPKASGYNPVRWLILEELVLELLPKLCDSLGRPALPVEVHRHLVNPVSARTGGRLKEEQPTKPIASLPLVIALLRFMAQCGLIKWDRLQAKHGPLRDAYYPLGRTYRITDKGFVLPPLEQSKDAGDQREARQLACEPDLDGEPLDM